MELSDSKASRSICGLKGGPWMCLSTGLNEAQTVGRSLVLC